MDEIKQIDNRIPIKILSVFFGIFYYICGFLAFFILSSYSYLFGTISYFSKALYAVCYIILPLLVLAMPVLIKMFGKKEFFKAVLLSCISVVIYFVILYVVNFCVFDYLKDFTTEKWNTDNYIFLRYIMLDDLEEEYDFVGMSTEEAMSVLGEKHYYFEKDCICYFVRSEFLDSCYYCLEFDENNRIVKTYTKHVD